MSDFLKDNAYGECLYCESINKNNFGGRFPCIFHAKNKNSVQASEFWSEIRAKKPTEYNGFIFPNFETYEFIDDGNVLSKAANFWDAGEIPIFKNDILFQNCEFGHVIFRHLVCENNVRFNSCKINVLLIENTIFKNVLELRNNEKIASILIHACTFEANSTNHTMVWHENNIESISISASKIDRHLVIGKDLGTLSLSIATSQLRTISIIACTIKSITSFNSQIILFSIDSTDINEFEMSKNYIDSLKLTNSQIGKFHSIILLNSIKFKNIFFQDDFFLQNVDDEDISPDYSFLKQYSDKKNRSEKISFETVKIKKDCIFSINNYNFRLFIINNFTTFSDQVFFSNIYIYEKFVLTNSNMSKVQLNSITIDPNCKEIVIHDTNLVDTLFNDVEWGDIHRIKANRDIFRQLKHANDKQSNYLTSHQFYSKEMDEYSKTIKTKSLEEKIIFFLGKYISNFSRSWTLPLSWIILAGIMFYSFTVYDLVSFLITFVVGLLSLILFLLFNELKPQNFSIFIYFATLLAVTIFLFSGQTLDNLAVFMNPFIGFLKSEPVQATTQVPCMTVSHNFLWLIHKVVSTFFIYHFVVALRRSTQR